MKPTERPVAEPHHGKPGFGPTPFGVVVDGDTCGEPCPGHLACHLPADHGGNHMHRDLPPPPPKPGCDNCRNSRMESGTCHVCGRKWGACAEAAGDEDDAPHYARGEPEVACGPCSTPTRHAMMVSDPGHETVFTCPLCDNVVELMWP